MEEDFKIIGVDSLSYKIYNKHLFTNSNIIAYTEGFHNKNIKFFLYRYDNPILFQIPIFIYKENLKYNKYNVFYFRRGNLTENRVRSFGLIFLKRDRIITNNPYIGHSYMNFYFVSHEFKGYNYYHRRDLIDINFVDGVVLYNRMIGLRRYGINIINKENKTKYTYE